MTKNSFGKTLFPKSGVRRVQMARKVRAKTCKKCGKPQKMCKCK